jgi:membrane fusion protein, multidrug efflux system
MLKKAIGLKKINGNQQQWFCRTGPTKQPANYSLLFRQGSTDTSRHGVSAAKNYARLSRMPPAFSSKVEPDSRTPNTIAQKARASRRFRNTPAWSNVRRTQQSLFHAARLATISIALVMAPASKPAAIAQTTSTSPDNRVIGLKAGVGVPQFPQREAVTAPIGVTSGGHARFLVRSYETAAIGAELNAKITRLPEREGDRFRKGDVIVEFDCRKINVEHRAAIAVFNIHKANFENQRQMLIYHAVGTLAVDQARFEMEKASADVDGLEVKRLSCKVYAPFDGRVTEKAAQVHEIAQANQPLIRILNESKLELVLLVPSAWISRVADKSNFSIKIDETGEMHQARIIQSTGLIDPVSQSTRFIAEILPPSSTVLPGMSGTALFSHSEGAQ